MITFYKWGGRWETEELSNNALSEKEHQAVVRETGKMGGVGGRTRGRGKRDGRERKGEERRKQRRERIGEKEKKGRETNYTIFIHGDLHVNIL